MSCSAVMRERNTTMCIQINNKKPPIKESFLNKTSLG